MTLKTSSAERGIVAVFCTQLRSLRFLAALFLPLLFLVPASAVLIQVNSDQVRLLLSTGNAQRILDNVNLCHSIFGTLPLLLMAAVMAYLGFGYLHQKRRVDFVHALPVRRENQFFGRVLAGGFYLLCGVLLAYIGETLAVVAAGGGVMEVLGPHWTRLPVTLLSVLAAYVFAVMLTVLTATVWEMLFSLMVFSAAVPVVLWLAAWLTLRSMPISALYFTAPEMAALSPIVFSAAACITIADNTIFSMLLVALAQLLVCGAVAFFGYKRRRSELAEDSLAPTRLKLVLRAVSCTVLFFVGGTFGLWVTDSYPGYLIFAVVGALLAHLMLELIFRQSLRGVLKSTGTLAVGAAVFLAFNAALAFGLIGVPQLPALPDIEAVSVSASGSEIDADGEYISWGETEMHQSNSVWDEDGVMRFWRPASSAPGHVEAVHALAETMLESQRNAFFPYHPQPSYRINPNIYEAGDPHYSVAVTLFLDGVRRNLNISGPMSRMNGQKIAEEAWAIASERAYAEQALELEFAYVDGMTSVAGERMRVDGSMESVVVPIAEADRARWAARLKEALLLDTISSVPQDAFNADQSGKSADETATVSAGRSYRVPASPDTPVTFTGGYFDDGLPAAGITCTLDIKVEDRPSDASLYIETNVKSKTAAVLDELFGEAE